MRNNWIPPTPLEQMANTEYDVLIIGTGAGGGAVTWRLCEQWGENGKKIGVVESGDFLLPTQAANIPTMNSERMGKLHEYVSKPLGKFNPEFQGAKQVFAFGGRTLFWNAISPRMNLFELVDWPVTFQEMESYYDIAERVMNVSKKYTEGSSLTEILLNRLQQSGVTEATATPIAADLGPAIYGQEGSDVFFGAINFFAKALNHRQIDLTVKTRAVKVLVENGEVVGVKVISSEKKPYILKAKTVVLSASTFETPRLLLHSGIQGQAIGHYLMNHSFVLANGTISREEFPEPLGTLSILIPSTRERHYQIQLRGPNGYFWYQPYQVKPFVHELEITFFGSGEVEPRFENKVTLDPNRKDEFGVPEVQIDFSFSEKDLSIIREIAGAIEQVSSFCGINKPSICLMPPGDQNHDSGTCRMGDDPSTSAVNRYGQLHGIKGLFVADNSVFPSIGAANLTLSTAALAIRTADYIIRQESALT
ncbi:choline dehydrogenase-like flavoprotein [Neobacillus niacini]|uniref:GMC oxidoreductase n=1 Tax=Neobacillus niacini TaxID=86668 RepID=UPI002788810B|nr:GMC family oxidoreductase [Neobacillus niacini]MDQ1005281.1 choline dehydrogenase-like flavoprotein [Neobacillus niacini]